ncbi:MAG: uracil-DNA glycosylase [Solirubrobacteraceae bacterium]|nr:uracil-DNA glycosylase [Solirubrobacteraceae bacterium]
MAKASGEAKLRAEADGCTRCPQLVASRSQVVFASGSIDAELMFVGEAPGATEDREGVPFVGASGRLLDDLLAGIGISRDEVYIANVLKCRPPDNRDPRADEIANCFEYLQRQVEIVEPTVVVTLGNFASKLLRNDDTAISTIRGRPEICQIGARTVWLLPVFHPAAALYRRPNLELLRDDFKLLPLLVSRGAPDQKQAASGSREAAGDAEASARPDSEDDPPQLDLF